MEEEPDHGLVRELRRNAVEALVHAYLNNAAFRSVAEACQLPAVTNMCVLLDE